MMIRSLLFAACFALSAPSSVGAQCLEEAPPTVYEAETMSPQNMDFDSVNNLFIAHAGWYNDALVHYYKFRIFAPSTYEGAITPNSAASDVPVQKIYFVTSTGGFDGVIGKPILEYHHVDGVLYSDFVDVHFVMAPQGYTADAIKSFEDIIDSGAVVNKAGILMNMPVVPTGSYLQDPIAKGTNRAPIDPVPVWYNCVEVWTYVFEVTDSLAAIYFADTRTTDDVVVATGRSTGSGFEIPVTPSMGDPSATTTNAVPIWHINQYTRGVEAGSGGGPDPNGMRNVINLDRPDAGYSPLWQIFWGTQLPIDYSANQASHSNALTGNGFVFITTPMFVNCPNIGPVDKADLNEDMKDAFQSEIVLSEETQWIMGSDQSLIFENNMTITFMTENDVTIGSTMTNIMGAYEFELNTTDIPEGTNAIMVMFMDDVIRTVPIDGVPGSGVAPGTIDNNVTNTDDDSGGCLSMSYGLSAVVVASGIFWAIW